MTPAIHVAGVGFWAPGFPGAAAWASGLADPGVAEPPAAMLAAALRRRASGLTRMVAEVAAQAAGQAGGDLASVPLILGSALGEVDSATSIIASFREPGGLPSPTRFHNSVHNTAVGYLSIATGNRLGASAVAAGAGTVLAAFLEAAATLGDRGGAALILLADEELPVPFRGWGAYRSAAAALWLTAEPTARTRARLEGLRHGPAAPPDLPEGWRDHPCGAGLALVAAIERGRVGPRGLGTVGDDGWVIDLAPGSL